MKRSVMWSVAIALGVSAVWAAPDAVDLRYRPEVGRETAYVLTGKTTEVLMGGAPVGVSGGVTLDLAFKVIEANEDSFVLEIVASNIEADLNGDLQEPAAPPPMKITMSLTGEVLSIEAPEGPMDVMSTGAAPVPLLVVALAALPFKGEPVGVGDAWEASAKAALGTYGDLELQIESNVAEITDETAKIETKMHTEIPSFDIPNPFIPEAVVSIAGGSIKVDDLTRLFDHQRGELLEGAGSMDIELKMDMGGGEPMPVTLKIKAELKRKDGIVEGEAAAEGEHHGED